MMIDFNDETNSVKEAHITLINDVLLFAATKEKVSPLAEVSVTVVTDEAIKQLNKQYRNINDATDVLSFPLLETFEDWDENMPVMLGDIIVSIDKVKEQAIRYNHSYERELIFLIVHGFLHLLGYTHDSEDEETIMFAKQENVLKEFELERG